MDLKSLLNTGKPPLTEERIASLIENSDNGYKLEQMTDATFTIPDQPEACYHYLDRFLQLLASFDYNNDSDLDMQYTTTALVACLRACVNELLISNGLPWLLSLPHHISDITWTMLESSATILAYVYGLLLAMATRQQVEISTWVEEMAYFVKAASPYLNAHLWLNITGLEQRPGQNNDSELVKSTSPEYSDYAASFLLCVERFFNSKSPSQPIQNALISMLYVLEDGQASTLSSAIDQYLGNVASRPSFTDQELVVGKLAFDQYVELCKAMNLMKLLNQYDIQRQNNSDEDSDVQINPLISDVLMEMPAGGELERAQILEKPLAQWCYQLQTFPYNDFDYHLRKIIEKHYPNDRKTNLDLLLTEWIQRDEIVGYLEPVIGYITARLRAEKYDKRSSPFWSFINLYAETDYQRSDQKALYGEVSGAQVDSDIDYAWDDSRRQRTCDKVLQILTYTNTDEALTAWINDILQVASARVLARYLEWVSYKVNSIIASQGEHSSGLRNNLYYKQLNNVFKGDHIKTKSDTVIPTLMRTLHPAIFLNLVETRAYLNAMVKSYFLKPPEMTFELLANEILQSQTKEFVLGLFNVLGVQNRQNSQWFANHFLGPVLRHETENIGSQSLILKHLLVTDHFFTNLFLRTFNTSMKGTATVDAPVKTSTIQLLCKHVVLKSQSCGLLRFFEEIVRLREPKRQTCILDIWRSSWAHDKALKVNDQWLVCCLLFYGHASAAVQQLIETFVCGHLETLLFAPDSYKLPPAESLLTNRGDTLSFLTRVVDLTLLADMVDPEDVFVMIIAQLMSMSGPEHINDTHGKVNASKVLYRAVVILTETADELALMMEKDNENTMDIDSEVGNGSKEKKAGVKQKNKRQRLEHQKKGRVKKGRSQYIASELPSDLTDSDPATDRHSLTLYAQRIVSLFSSVLTGDGIRYITADIRHFITQSWANCQDLYIPLAFLMTIKSQDTMMDDIVKIVHVLRVAVADSNPVIETIIETEEKRHNISFVNS